MLEAIDHLDLVVSDFDRSLRFYVELLRPLGYVRTSEIEGERGERVVYVGRPGGFGSVSVREAQSGAHGTPYDRYGIGIHHIAFSATRRSVVDERAEWLRANGHEIESGPGEYNQYSPGYYAVFFYDPDGIKLEILHRPREQDLAARVQELERRLAALEGGG
ncbi:MAG TPA: VOC family protein [Solirubrobacteraceae bacterium]|jgi:catechol 2,3-dioxygenase-like lactoylglutathione lyase family enzyme|nr:VOC family protein [Solirubrobacteraceae bacterium]